MAGEKAPAQAFVLADAPDVHLSSVAGRVGLRNIGNTCFMNAGLQCLCHIEPLVAYFLTGEYDKEVNATNPLGCKGEVAHAFAKVVRSLWQGEESPHDPRELHRKLVRFAPHLFEGYQQQDVQEFLAFFVDGLHEDLNRVSCRPPPISSEQERDDERLGDEQGEEVAAALAWYRHLERGKSHMVDLLQGQLRSTLTCSRCGHTSRRFDPFLYLSVPVTKAMKNVTDAVGKFLERETLRGKEQWHCEKCKRKVDAGKKIDLWKLPPVLVLHLKRFEFDAATMSYNKTENRLSMKLSNLDLTEYCSSMQKDGAVYDVIGVANHTGSYGSGHYTATCKVGSAWFHYNDSLVQQFDSGRSVVTRGTYMIFLVRHREKDQPFLKGARAECRRSLPVLARRQTLSVPGNWPHPEASAAAVLRATCGRGGGSTEAAAAAAAEAGSAASSGTSTTARGDGDTEVETESSPGASSPRSQPGSPGRPAAEPMAARRPTEEPPSPSAGQSLLKRRRTLQDFGFRTTPSPQTPPHPEDPSTPAPPPSAAPAAAPAASPSLSPWPSPSPSPSPAPATVPASPAPVSAPAPSAPRLPAPAAAAPAQSAAPAPVAPAQPAAPAAVVPVQSAAPAPSAPAAPVRAPALAAPEPAPTSAPAAPPAAPGSAQLPEPAPMPEAPVPAPASAAAARTLAAAPAAAPTLAKAPTRALCRARSSASATPKRTPAPGPSRLPAPVALTLPRVKGKK